MIVCKYCGKEVFENVEDYSDHVVLHMANADIAIIEWEHYVIHPDKISIKQAFIDGFNKGKEAIK